MSWWCLRWNIAVFALRLHMNLEVGIFSNNWFVTFLTTRGKRNYSHNEMDESDTLPPATDNASAKKQKLETAARGCQEDLAFQHHPTKRGRPFKRDRGKGLHRVEGYTLKVVFRGAGRVHCCDVIFPAVFRSRPLASLLWEHHAASCLTQLLQVASHILRSTLFASFIPPAFCHRWMRTAVVQRCSHVPCLCCAHEGRGNSFCLRQHSSWRCHFWHDLVRMIASFTCFPHRVPQPEQEPVPQAKITDGFDLTKKSHCKQDKCDFWLLPHVYVSQKQRVQNRTKLSFRAQSKEPTANSGKTRLLSPRAAASVPVKNADTVMHARNASGKGSQAAGESLHHEAAIFFASPRTSKWPFGSDSIERGCRAKSCTTSKDTTGMPAKLLSSEVACRPNKKTIRHESFHRVRGPKVNRWQWSIFTYDFSDAEGEGNKKENELNPDDTESHGDGWVEYWSQICSLATGYISLSWACGWLSV